MNKHDYDDNDNGSYNNYSNYKTNDDTRNHENDIIIIRNTEDGNEDNKYDRDKIIHRNINIINNNHSLTVTAAAKLL